MNMLREDKVGVEMITLRQVVVDMARYEVDEGKVRKVRECKTGKKGKIGKQG